MQKNEYDEMHALEADFWWFAGMRDITSAVLARFVHDRPKRLLDIGCGTGINLLWMGKTVRPNFIVGCDYAAAALEWCKVTIRQAPGSDANSRPVLARGDVRHLPFASDSFDLFTILDVLDQFPPGEQVLQSFRELLRVLRPGGVAFVRSPAYRWLLSSHDYVYETKCRYSSRELRGVMEAAGFEILESTYANTLLFPLALLQRGLRILTGYRQQKTDAQPWPPSLAWLNSLFRSCLGAEARWLRSSRRLPFGLSVICVARKP
jgi:SAM-dependent methyltransferase